MKETAAARSTSGIWNIMQGHPAETLMDITEFTAFVEGLDHPEAVACGPRGELYASGEAGQVYRVDLATGSVTQLGTTGGFALGLCLDADYNVYACDLARHAVIRVTPSGETSVYSDGAPNRKMVTPNYPVFDAKGNLYVSDSGSWNGNDGCLFLVRPGGETVLLTDELSAFPNGMALHPNGSWLYVVVSQLPGVVRCAIKPDGTLGEIETVVELPYHVPDGLAFDVQHNLYICCYTPDIIYRLTPEGELAVLASDWQSVTFATPTNIAFCGEDRQTLVVGSLSRWHLAKGRMPVAGQPLHYPRIAAS
ncbi:MAG TPA: SMP-30/gluconolactonase/LRE family protein [Thermomicrobiales bacterium]